MRAKLGWVVLIVLAGSAVVRAYRTEEQELLALRGEIALLRERQDRLAASVRPPIVVRTQAPAVEREPDAARPSIGAATAAEPDDGSTHDPLASSAATRAARWEAEARRNLESVQSAFAAEPVEDAWARPTRSALHERLAEVSRSSASSLGNIECRSTICAVDVVHSSADASRQFDARAFTDPHDHVWNGPVMMTPPKQNSDGSVAVVMYLGREGTSLLK